MIGWSDALDPVTATVECGGVEHRITWRRGALVLHDHDEKAERAFVALGGERPFCLDVLDAFRTPIEDAETLRRALGGQFIESRPVGAYRTLSRQLTRLPPQGLPPASIASFVRTAAMTHALGGPSLPAEFVRRRQEEHARQLRVLRQESLPPELRLVAALAGLVRRQRQDTTEVPPDDVMGLNRALDRAARTACIDSARTWHARLPPDVETAVMTSYLVTQRARAQVSGYLHRRGGELYVELPHRWIVDVWAAGIAIVDGWFVLDIERRLAPRTLRVRAINWVIRRDGTICPEEHRLTITHRPACWVVT